MGITSSKQQSSSLLTQCMEGNLNEVKRLVGIHIANNSNGKSSLSTYINSTDAAGNAAIHGCVFAGHLDILKFLVESCSSCSSDDENDTKNNSGVNLQLKNGLGCTPLWIAAGYNQINCLQYLINQLYTANQLEKALLEANSTGDTPFIAAVSKGNIEAVKCLLKVANEKCTYKSYTPEKYMRCNLLRTTNNSDDTPLKVAVATNQSEELIELLLKEDEICQEFLWNNADEEFASVQSTCINRKNQAGLSPLIIACERNLPSIVELLLKHGAEKYIKDNKGRGPLAVASFCGCDEVVDYLLNGTDSYKLVLNCVDDNECTPLWLAARTGNLKMVKVLVDAGADKSRADKDGLSPQDVASKFKKDKVEEYFTQMSSTSSS